VEIAEISPPQCSFGGGRRSLAFDSVARSTSVAGSVIPSGSAVGGFGERCRTPVTEVEIVVHCTVTRRTDRGIGVVLGARTKEVVVDDRELVRIERRCRNEQVAGEGRNREPPERSKPPSEIAMPCPRDSSAEKRREPRPLPSSGSTPFSNWTRREVSGVYTTAETGRREPIRQLCGGSRPTPH